MKTTGLGFLVLLQLLGGVIGTGIAVLIVWLVPGNNVALGSLLGFFGGLGGVLAGTVVTHRIAGEA